VILFIGGLMTANAMAYFDGEIEKAVVLIISYRTCLIFVQHEARMTKNP